MKKNHITRNYSSVDLFRFKKFSEENPELKSHYLLKAYNEIYPELSAKEKLQNLASALGVTIDQLIQKK